MNAIFKKVIRQSLETPKTFPHPEVMKKLLFSLLLTAVFGQEVQSQSNPVSLRSDVTIQALRPAPHFSSGIAYDPVSSKLFYTRLNGDIHRMNYPGPLPATDSVLYTTADHGIITLKGLLFSDSTLYLIGNNNQDTTLTIGIIKRGVLLPGGGRIWSTVMETEPYQLGNGAFDHGISGLCLSAAGDSIYFNSGSRTDHGEEQENTGLYPGLREVPLTSAIFRIPANAVSLTLMNDSAQLAPYLFADGIRNTFKMIIDTHGHLIGCENSGDSDDPDELNHLQYGQHYGFPWVMGGNMNKQQFPWYDPATDFMINPLRQSYQNGYFYNDPLFPQKPAALMISDAIQNNGNDADKYRDTITGIVNDASDLGITLGTFTTHRSPLGLVLDSDSLLVWDLKGNGFVFSNQKGGDSLGNAPGGGFGTLLDPGEDMLSVKFFYDAFAGTYSIEVTEVITGFLRPVDACMVGTKIYLLEHGRPIEPGTIYEISMPEDLTGINNFNNVSGYVNVYPNPVAEKLNIELEINQEKGIEFSLCNVLGDKIKTFSITPSHQSNRKITIDTGNLSPGIYFIHFIGESNSTVRFVKL